MCVVLDKGVRTFECVDELTCNRIVQDCAAELVRDCAAELVRDCAAELVRAREQRLQEKFKDLIIDDDFLDECEELPRFRDASIHMYHRGNDVLVTKNMANNGYRTSIRDCARPANFRHYQTKSDQKHKAQRRAKHEPKP
ncbi:MAG: hypothetical protein ACYCOU_03840 [Sulfobacillus sp.]